MLLIVFTFGCAPKVFDGRRIEAEKVKQLTLGQTSSGKVEELFGKPARIEKAEPGIEMYIYTYSATEPHWWTIDRIEKQEFEAGMQNGVLKYYKLVWEEEEAILKEW